MYRVMTREDGSQVLPTLIDYKFEVRSPYTVIT
jgi:hypothetical protein